MTTTNFITKSEIEKLIKVLGNFKLGFGCEVIYGIHTKIKLISKWGATDKWQCVSRGGTIIKCHPKEFKKILGHPIMIGNVFQKMKELAGQIHDTVQEGDKIKKLVRLWGACEIPKTIISLSRSFQEITADKEWEKIEIKKAGKLRGTGHKLDADSFLTNMETVIIKRLKSESANDLAIFLRDLFLNK